MKLLKNVEIANKIAYQNVVRKRSKFHYSEMERYYEEFASGIVEAGYTLKGPYLYSLNNVPKDEMVDIEMFFPIQESVFERKDYQFSSYMEVKSLIKRVVSHDFEILTEQAYAELLETLEMNQLQINTPFYHIVPVNGLQYVEILLGYAAGL